MAPLRTPHVFNEATKLLAQSNQNLVLILDRFYSDILERLMCKIVA